MFRELILSLEFETKLRRIVKIVYRKNYFIILIKLINSRIIGLCKMEL